MKVPVPTTSGLVVESQDEMKKVYSYIRFSTPQQSLGDSLRRQVAAAELFCKENGYTLDTTLTLHDKGVSAFKGKNIEIGRLGEFLRLVKSGKIKKGSALCVENLDRLSRGEITEALEIFMGLLRDGINIITLTDKRIYSKDSVNKNPGEIMMSIIFMMRAHDESKIKSGRVKEAYDSRKRNAKEHGLQLLGWNPPWCDFVQGKGYVVNIERANIVKRIYAEYLKGNGPYLISHLFNRENIPTLGHRGNSVYKNTTKSWYKKTVRDFLFDKRVYGFCEFLDKEDYYPVIIPKKTFEAVQNRLTIRRDAQPTGGPSENMGNIFTGVCRCIHCNSVMAKTITHKTYKGKRTRYEYLVCENARMGNKCSYRSIPYNVFEDSFLGSIRTDSFYTTLTENNPNQSLETELESLRGEMVMAEQQIKKISDKFLDDANPSVTLVNLLKKFESRQIIIQKEIKLKTAQLETAANVPSDFREMMKQANTLITTKDGRLKLREYIRNTINKILVDTSKDIYTYQIHFKTGFVGYVVTWFEKPSKGAGMYCFQSWGTEIKTPQYNTPIMILNKGKDEQTQGNILRILTKKRFEMK